MVTVPPMITLFSSDRPNGLKLGLNAYLKLENVKWVNHGVVSKVKLVSRKDSTNIQ